MKNLKNAFSLAIVLNQRHLNYTQPPSKKILVRRDVIFNENVSWDGSKEHEPQ